MILSMKEHQRERKDSKKGTKRERKTVLNLPLLKGKQKVESKALKREGVESKKNTKSKSKTFNLKIMKRLISLSISKFFHLSSL